MTNASWSERPRMCVRGNTSSMPLSTISSTTSVVVMADSVSNTAWPHGFIFSFSVPGR